MMSVDPVAGVLESRVNDVVANHQRAGDRRSVAMDANGNSVVVWADLGTTGRGNVYAQRYDAAGATRGARIQVNNTLGTAFGRGPAVAMDSSGAFVVVWNSPDQGTDLGELYGRRFNSTGTALSNQFIVASNVGDADATVATNSSGQFVVAWCSNRAVYAQRYHSTGYANGSVITAFEASNRVFDYFYTNPQVALGSDGSMVAVCQGNYSYNANFKSVSISRFDARGVALSVITPFVQSGQLIAQGFGDTPDIAMDANGNFVVICNDTRSGTSNVVGQRYSSNGTAIGTNFRANLSASTSATSPSVAMSPSGEFRIVWTSTGQNVDGTSDIYGQRFNVNGSPIGQEQVINTYLRGNQTGASVAMDNNGHFAIAWTSDGQDGSGAGVYVRNIGFPPVLNDVTFTVNEHSPVGTIVGRVTATDADAAATLRYRIAAGNNLGVFAINSVTGEITVANSTRLNRESQESMTLTVEVSDGGTITPRTDTASVVIQLRDINDNAPLITSRNMVFHPENTTSVITITAVDADSSSQRPALSIVGGADAAKFQLSQSGLLSFSAAPNFEASTDANRDNVYEVQVRATDGTLSSTQTIRVNVYDTRQPVDLTLPGTGGVFTVRNSDGRLSVRASNGTELLVATEIADVSVLRLIGSSNADTVLLDTSIANFTGTVDFTGGAGNDKLDAGNVNFSVRMNGDAGNDSLIGGSGADSFLGGIGDDYSVGNSGRDWLVGDDGNDQLDGGADDDAVSGGAGNDTLLGGAGNDRIAGAAGADSLNGGDGIDTLNGGAGDDVLTGGLGNDAMNGGSGMDSLYEVADTNFTLTATQLISTATGTETLVGIERAVLVGGASNNRIDASASSIPVVLLGGAGNDTLLGGAIGDVLIGGSRSNPASGSDSLVGNAGADKFDNDAADQRVVNTGDSVVANVFSFIDGWIDSL